MIHITHGHQLAAAVHRELRAMLDRGAITRADDPGQGQPGDLFLGILENARLDRLLEWERQARARRMRFLPIHIQGGEAIVGPCVETDRPGCLTCWAGRYFGARRHARACAQPRAPSSLDPPADPWLTVLTASIIGALAARHVRAHVDAGGGRPTEGAADWTACYFNLRTMSGRTWAVAPDSSCPVCSERPSDSAEHAHIELAYAEKGSEETDRLRPLTELAGVGRTYAGHRSNVVSSHYVNWNFKCGAVASVTVTLSAGRPPEPCSGFCANYEDAQTVAVLEGLERVAGVRPCGIRPFARGSIASLGALAVDPRPFGLHAPEEYAEFPQLLTPFTEALELDFVWAWSFRQRQSVLVPKQLAYYGRAAPGRSTFVIEGSVGCALGGSVEECVLHGIFEVVERDAFLLTWYARMAPPQLDLLDCTDPEVRYRYRFLRAEGFDVFTFDISTDYAIPAIGILARRRDGQMPAALFVSAAHAKPAQAIKKALRELTATYGRYQVELQHESNRRRASAMVEDPRQVRSMSDHALFYCVPASGRHLDFLFDSPRRTSLADLDDGARALRSRNMGRDLVAAVDRLMAAGSDVLAVKQTPPELATHGLHVCKTLISDAIPMTWGRHRRLENMRRLDARLRRQGRAGGTAPIPNPAPHPYP